MYRILSAHGLFSLARAFIGAVLVIYLIDQGIDLSVIAIAKAAQLVVSVIFNYPAGLISDRYGNKSAILLACIFEIIYFYLMINPSDTTVILAEMFNGLGIAFYMGAYEAWLFTHKKHNEDSFSLISRSSEMLFMATIVSGVIGAVFSQYSLMLSILFMALSFTAYALTPALPKNNREIVSDTDNDPSAGLVKFFRTADVNVVNYVIVGGLIQLVYQFWPIFFKNAPFSFPPETVGYVFAGAMFTQWLFTAYARRINFNKKTYAASCCHIGIIITSLATISAPYYLMRAPLLAVILYCFFISFCTVTVNYYFSRSCNVYSGSHDESSMISLLDTSARCVGALSLAIVSLMNIQNISIIWAALPVFILALFAIKKAKRTLFYGV